MTDEKAKHFSTGKLGIDQIPDFVLAELGLVYSYGEIKYTTTLLYDDAVERLLNDIVWTSALIIQIENVLHAACVEAVTINGFDTIIQSMQQSSEYTNESGTPTTRKPSTSTNVLGTLLTPISVKQEIARANSLHTGSPQKDIEPYTLIKVGDAPFVAKKLLSLPWITITLQDKYAVSYVSPVILDSVCSKILRELLARLSDTSRLRLEGASLIVSARNNWKLGTEWHEFIGSAKRHFAYWCLGQDEDSESGINHLSHAIWNLIALRYYQKTGGGVDDRPFDARLHAGMDEPITDADDILTKLADVQARANAWKESHA